jgi:aminoglycoside phosphotransferase (APT) family kinase protein
MMTDPEETQAFEHLAQRIDPQCRLLRSWPLAGGVSAQVTALELLRPDGQIWRVVVRQHGEGDVRRNPHVAHDEFRLLHILQLAGVAAPKPVYLDATGEIYFTPALVVEYVEGKAEFSPADLDDFLSQVAAHLVQIHCVDGVHWDLSFLPKQTRGWAERSATLDESLAEGRIRDALEAQWPLSRMNEPILLHGDYWPGNLLWKDDRLAAVIDWEDAAVGDPLADVSNSRLEILWAFGVDAMEAFTENYRTLTSSYWDLCAALRPASKLSTWGLDAATERSMRKRHRFFVAQALNGDQPGT